MCIRDRYRTDHSSRRNGNDRRYRRDIRSHRQLDSDASGTLVDRTLHPQDGEACDLCREMCIRDRAYRLGLDIDLARYIRNARELIELIWSWQQIYYGCLLYTSIIRPDSENTVSEEVVVYAYTVYD